MSRAFSYIAKEEANDGKQMKIGEVSKLTGVGIETLRFYEKSGLLSRPGRTYSGYRIYNEDVLERIAFIKQAQILGFSLDEIKQIIDHKQQGMSPCLEVRDLVREKLTALNERIAQLIQYRDELTDALAEWDKTGEAEGHVCGLIESSHIDHPINTRTTKRKN